MTNAIPGEVPRTLPPAAYTAIVHGKDNGTAIGLVEVYDLDQTADSQLANTSTRGFVDTRDNAMIGGFIVDAASSTTVLLRAIGPSLSDPTDDREAAIVADLNPGPYTAIVRGKDDTVGVALMEVHNLQ